MPGEIALLWCVLSAHLRSAESVLSSVTPWEQHSEGGSSLPRSTPLRKHSREEVTAGPGSGSDHEAGFISQTHCQL